jgi:hypothetical protein
VLAQWPDRDKQCCIGGFLCPLGEWMGAYMTGSSEGYPPCVYLNLNGLADHPVHISGLCGEDGVVLDYEQRSARSIAATYL